MDYKAQIAQLRVRYNSLLAAIKKDNIFDMIEALEALGLTPADLPLEELVWPRRPIPLRRAIEALMIEADMTADKLEKEAVALPPRPPKKPIVFPDASKLLHHGLRQIEAKNAAMIADVLTKRSSDNPVGALAMPLPEVIVTKMTSPTSPTKTQNLATVTEKDQRADSIPNLDLETVTKTTSKPEQAKPKRPRGRPSSGERAMTPAEKQAAYRARQKMKKVTVTFDRTDADELLTYLTAVAGDISYPLDKQLALRLRDACQSAWVSQRVPQTEFSDEEKR
ncbi:hypothetical protein [Aeromonas sp. HMWF016]|uniref:hypothetical protein n=1 Tax=Aeromonas sp. HMWF016 TaxID=2056852 RepID=UPI000D36776A|nr:hypothetical protein [Aeromonas sp. HMWF016]PTT46458.1 hypothetical protein DBR09_11495 [Aeromonas sp. HMWF016]